MIGTGTIGSNLTCALSGNAFRKFNFVDPDKISERNIPLCVPFSLKDARAPKVTTLKRFLEAKYAERVDIKAYPQYVDQVPISVVTDADLLVLAVDNNATKLFVTYNRVKALKPMVVLGFWGWEASYMLVLPKITACWACLFRPKNRKEVERMKRINRCPEPEPNIPGAVIQGTVSRLIGIAANEITKFCLNEGRIAQYHVFHALTGEEETRFLDGENHLKPDPDCPICQRWEGVDVSELRERERRFG